MNLTLVRLLAMHDPERENPPRFHRRRRLTLAATFCSLCYPLVGKTQSAKLFGCLPLLGSFNDADLTPLQPLASSRERWMHDELVRLCHEEQVQASLFWIETENAYALPGNRIAFGRELAKVIDFQMNDLTIDQRDTIFRFIMGHEFSHILQARQSQNVVPVSVRGKELQADIGGGAWLALRLTSPGGELDSVQSKRAIIFAGAIGGTDWTDPSAHGTRQERFDACTLGTIIGGQVRLDSDGANTATRRLSQILFSPNGVKLAIGAEIAAAVGHQWNEFFEALPAALVARNNLPVSPDGVDPREVPELDGGFYYEFVSADAKNSSEHFDVTFYQNNLHWLFPEWAVLSEFRERLSSTPDALKNVISEERQRISTIAADPSAKINRLQVFQEIDEHNVRITCAKIKINENSYVVLAIFNIQKLSDEETSAFTRLRDTRTRTDDDNAESDNNDAAEPFDFARRWMVFLNSVRSNAEECRETEILRTRLISINVPAGVSRVSKKGAAEFWFILFDTANSENGEKNANYVWQHVLSTFSATNWSEPLPKQLGVPQKPSLIATAIRIADEQTDGSDFALEEQHTFDWDGRKDGPATSVDAISLQKKTTSDQANRKLLLLHISLQPK
jgi:hypothetical protein